MTEREVRKRLRGESNSTEWKAGGNPEKRREIICRAETDAKFTRYIVKDGPFAQDRARLLAGVQWRSGPIPRRIVWSTARRKGTAGSSPGVAAY